MARPELRIARGFGECKGLTAQELEDIYQDTVMVLLQRRFATEKHLRDALRSGLKYRALNFHRDEGNRAEILAEKQPDVRCARAGRPRQHRARRADP